MHLAIHRGAKARGNTRPLEQRPSSPAVEKEVLTQGIKTVTTEKTPEKDPNTHAERRAPKAKLIYVRSSVPQTRYKSSATKLNLERRKRT